MSFPSISRSIGVSTAADEINPLLCETESKHNNYPTLLSANDLKVVDSGPIRSKFVYRDQGEGGKRERGGRRGREDGREWEIGSNEGNGHHHLLFVEEVTPRLLRLPSHVYTDRRRLGTLTIIYM